MFWCSNQLQVHFFVTVLPQSYEIVSHIYLYFLKEYLRANCPHFRAFIMCLVIKITIPGRLFKVLISSSS